MSRPLRFYPLIAIVAASAVAAFWAGFAFDVGGEEASVRQISKLRAGPVDIYTQEALRKELAALPR